MRLVDGTVLRLRRLREEDGYRRAKDAMYQSPVGQHGRSPLVLIGLTAHRDYSHGTSDL